MSVSAVMAVVRRTERLVRGVTATGRVNARRAMGRER